MVHLRLLNQKKSEIGQREAQNSAFSLDFSLFSRVLRVF